MEKTRAWIYCRIDAPEDSHGVLKGQKKELTDYAEQMGFTVVGASDDVGSGLDFNRPGLLEVTKAAGENEMDVLLAVRADRLGRDATKTMELLKALDELGVKVCSPLEGEITLRQSNTLLNFGMKME